MTDVILTHQKPGHCHSYLQKISFEGTGMIGGTQINFSPELNTLIGIRGSGKSSILEGIRYALGIDFGEKTADIDYKKNLLKHMLGSGGKITIDAIDRHGQHYQIHRILGERADVFIADQPQPGISIRETVVYNPIYFGQKDLSTTGSGFENDLIEKLVGEALIPIRQQIDQQKQTILGMITQLTRVKNNTEQKQEWMQKQQETQRRLHIYQQHGIEEKLQQQIDLDRDERKIQQLIGLTQNYFAELNQFVVSHEDELKDQTYHSAQNQSFFDDFFSLYQQILTSFTPIKSAADDGQRLVTQLQDKLTQFHHQKQTLKDAFAQVERQLSRDLKAAGATAINLPEFRQLKSTLEQCEQMLKVLNQSEQQREQLQTELKQALTQLNALWYQEYQTIEQALKSINAADSPLKITPAFQADKVAMLTFMRDVFRGSEIKENTLKILIDQSATFADIWHCWDEIIKPLNCDLTTLTQYFENNLPSLLTFQIPNTFTTKYHGKTLQQHSLGQRASALILFVLSQRDNDVVVIDQPEDDLDNQTIYEDVIKLIRTLKPTTQFILATHNANIPVLGDAEQVIVCRCTDDKISTIGGNIDNPDIQAKIVDIMEGGQAAFEKRKQVYDTWK